MAAFASWLVVLSSAPWVRGQEILLTGPLVGAEAVSNRASLVSERYVLPSGRMEFGGELTLVTSDREFGAHAVELTDLAFLHLRARRAFGSWMEFSLSTTVLPKQPYTLDEPIWQGARIGMLVQLPKAFAAMIWGGGGPLLEDEGYFWQAGSRVIFRPKLDRELAFELGGGATSTVLEFGSAPAKALYVYELSVGATLQAGGDGGGGWAGFEYHVPIASNREDAPFGAGMPAFEPTNRLDLRIGGVGGARNSWDLWVEYAIIDRGDVSEPRTSLPILDGGFDQRRLAVGVQHRFGGRSRK